MNPLYEALSLFRRKKFAQCRDICSENLKTNAYDQAFWVLKMRCFIQETYIDEIEIEEEGIAESLMDEHGISTPAPSTAIPPSTASQSIRPVSHAGRPITGILRPGSQSSGASALGLGTGRLSTARLTHSGRPLTSSQMAYHRRLGTASILPSSQSLNENEVPSDFLSVSRLNLAKYAQRSSIAKPLLQFLALVLGETRSALQLAAQTSEAQKDRSWWWCAMHGVCLFRMGLLRQAEKELRAASRVPSAHVDVSLWLAKTLERLRQPTAALEVLQNALNRYTGETLLLVHVARLQELQGELLACAQSYRFVLTIDPVNAEAIACLALQHFYDEQPEHALRLYRRVLQLKGPNARLYINLAICCFYAQQLQFVFVCIERALQSADCAEVRADVWYNAGLIALSSGDRQLSVQCFRLTVLLQSEHAEAYNNLAVLQLLSVSPPVQLSGATNDLPGAIRAVAAVKGINGIDGSDEEDGKRSAAILQLQKGLARAKSLLQTAVKYGPHLYEAQYNLAQLAEQLGEYDLAHSHVKESLALYPTHKASNLLYARLRKMYEAI